MATAHYALFVDLENCGAKIGTLNDVIEKVKIRGDILIGKVYGYTDKYSDLKELLLSNTFNVVPSIRYGRNQKNNLDIQLVLDALDVAFTNSLIDSFCIVSGDSDYVPLVGKLKSMGKFVLGISRSEAASSVFINACNEFQFLESVSQGKSSGRSQKDEPLTLDQLDELICTILEEQADENEILASELKNILLRLRPDFNEKSFGFSTFGKLLSGLSQRFGSFTVVADHFNLIVSSVMRNRRRPRPSSRATTTPRSSAATCAPSATTALSASTPPFSRPPSRTTIPTSPSAPSASSAFPTCCARWKRAACSRSRWTSRRPCW